MWVVELVVRSGWFVSNSGFHRLDGEQAAKLEVLDDRKLL